MGRIESIKERLLPDFKRRHVFTAKLRIVAFIGFWALYIFFFRDVIGQTKAISVIVLASFCLTGIAYYNLMRGRFLILSFFLELLCDLTAITAVLYLTGGPYSPYYTIYLFYALVAGIIYNYYLSLVIAALSILYFGAFLFLCDKGVVPPLLLDYGDKLPIPTYTPLAHFIFIIIFLGGIAYTVKVASSFSQEREQMLDKRNRELLALNRITSTIRSAGTLEGVISRILQCVLEGLGFDAAALVRFDRQAGRARLYIPERLPKLQAIEALAGRALGGAEFQLGGITPGFVAGLKKQRLIFSKRLSELAFDMGDGGFKAFLDRAQEVLKAKRCVMMPIVVEGELMGALVGLGREPFAGGEQVTTMESFANHSALSIEAADMIERLKRLNAQLNEASRVKSEFLATMSHELRTPLTAIIGFSELLVEGVMGELTDEQKEALSEVLHNSAELLDMINNLLDLTKIESGNMRLDCREYDPSVVARRVCSTITPLVQKKRQALMTDIEDGLRALTGDERKTHQALLNLLANANKFTPEGGRITVKVRGLDEGAVEMSVSDTGIGIRPEHIGEIFEMFHQADSSVTRAFGGTGLGLTLARKFVELQGGSIKAESEWGKGTSFTIVLPRAVPV